MLHSHSHSLHSSIKKHYNSVHIKNYVHMIFDICVSINSAPDNGSVCVQAWWETHWHTHTHTHTQTSIIIICWWLRHQLSGEALLLQRNSLNNITSAGSFCVIATGNYWKCQDECCFRTQPAECRHISISKWKNIHPLFMWQVIEGWVAPQTE